MIVGIDLHNIRDGGGPNYIRNLLEVADPALDGFEHIHLFGSADVVALLPDRAWITKHAVAELGRGLLSRLRFVAHRLPTALRAAGCDVLYAPGGLAFGNFRPYATISRNMMPFRPEFWSMYPRFSAERLRLRLLRQLNAATFARADGMIYLSRTAEQTIAPRLSRQPTHVAIIPHGVDQQRFSPAPRIAIAGPETPIRIVYPSRLEPYKHQVEVIVAFAAIMRDMPNATLTLCGPANPAYRSKVEDAIQAADPTNTRIHYIGEVPNASLPALYADSDLLVFASSCENMPNILIEAMACGIPICCSDRSPMPEIARDACLFFDPAVPSLIADSFVRALGDGKAMLERARLGICYAADYSWQTTARRTFALLGVVAASSTT
ncbi:glycosyltransferase family 4 protein [Sphingomonas sp. CFBP 13728]|uniref:glycosyltransferase family 4 protein n=1 Tax=Sphingomonas sp. CFBP 13728 TaxID=2775294 RepID=UPI001780998B|nr:glycosyltransferase family 1 protein [Sphingomonas sp. CFBP 13728]MBD8620607.1 glycosyltransferase family 4 protein [Sphingomonas sp. CFBP 13728]